VNDIVSFLRYFKICDSPEALDLGKAFGWGFWPQSNWLFIYLKGGEKVLEGFKFSSQCQWSSRPSGRMDTGSYYSVNCSNKFGTAQTAAPQTCYCIHERWWRNTYIKSFSDQAQKTL